MRTLEEYKKKRDFKKTAEPAVTVRKSKSKKLIFVIQEHHASHLHWDFRLEWEGVLKSWAVPKDPSLDPSTKRLAVEVEDHPIDYAKFQGTIPEGEYGGGEVFTWDKGFWIPKGDPDEGLRKGRLEFSLKGKRLHGDWVLVRTKRPTSGNKNQWLLIKRHDAYVEEGNSAEIIGSDETGSAKALKKRPKTSAKTEFEFIPPQLATLVDRPPTGEDWVHEVKFDGYRIQSHIERRSIRMLTRSGQDWTEKYSVIAKELQKLDVKSAIFDGEIVALDEQGRSHFQKLQNAMKAQDQRALRYYIFDLLYLNGEDLREKTLWERKDLLAEILEPHKKSVVLYSEHFDVEGEGFFETSCDMKLEGIVSKRLDSYYISGRNESWVKVKCKLQQEFVIGGFTEGQGTRVGFGALLLGVYERGKLRYVGKCGTGFDQNLLVDIKKKLKRIEVDDTPFEIGSPRGAGIHWVRPALVAEVNFSNWTDEGILRVPVFQGLREDKPAIEIHKEIPKKKATKPSEFSITHPDKIVFKKEKLTKLDLAKYYQEVAAFMLPHVVNRPLTLVRCPQGHYKSCFYQKHYQQGLPKEIFPVMVKEEKREQPYMAIDSEVGLTALVQMGALEIHLRNSRSDKLDNPDQFIMDFDPGPGVPWDRVIEGVLEMKEILEDLKLKTFVKTTGGKGLHIHVPIEPVYSWDQIKELTSTLAKEMTARNPDLYVYKMAKNLRHKKIFIDYLRNSSGATAIAPYSLRAKEVSAVAMPIEWDELEDLKSSNQFTLEKALKKIETRSRDPWQSYF